MFVFFFNSIFPRTSLSLKLMASLSCSFSDMFSSNRLLSLKISNSLAPLFFNEHAFLFFSCRKDAHKLAHLTSVCYMKMIPLKIKN